MVLLRSFVSTFHEDSMFQFQSVVLLLTAICCSSGLLFSYFFVTSGHYASVSLSKHKWN